MLKQHVWWLRCYARKKNRSVLQKQYWVHTEASERILNGQFYKIHADLRLHNKQCLKYYRISIKSIDDLFEIVGPKVMRKDNLFRKSVPYEKRLLHW